METIDCPHRSLSSDLSRLQVENKKHLVVAPRNGIAGKGKVLLLNVTRHSCALQVLPSLQYSQSADSSRPHSTATDPFSHVLSKSELLSLQSWNNVPSECLFSDCAYVTFLSQSVPCPTEHRSSFRYSVPCPTVRPSDFCH